MYIWIHISNMYVCMYIYMVSCSVIPPSNGMGPQVASPALLFASDLQHFWLRASHLLGICYLLEDLTYSLKVPYVPVVPRKAVAEVSKIGNL